VPKIRVIYWGSGEIGIPTLDMLATGSGGVELCAIVTRTDSPAGRSMQLRCTPIKEHALNGLPNNKSVYKVDNLEQLSDFNTDAIPLLTPEYIKGNREFRRILTALDPDAFIVCSYGQILTNLIIDKAKWSVCVHTSALPRMRGPSPVRAALALGLKQTEICTFLMTPRMDDGDVIFRKTIDIPHHMCFTELCREFSIYIPDLISDSLTGLTNGTVSAEPQNHSNATYTRLINKSDTWIDWNEDAECIRNRARALTPGLCITTTFRGRRLKLDMPLDVVDTTDNTKSPGKLFTLKESELLVQCGRNALLLKRIQPESKQWLTAQDFINGFAPKPGEEFITPNDVIEGRLPFETHIPSRGLSENIDIGKSTHQGRK
jgi:methionyl-tRNA formyltransferase